MATHHRRHQGTLIVGLLLIGLGMVFWVDQYLKIDLWGYLWPIVLIGVGLLFFAGMVSSGKGAGALAIPGSMCVMLGLVGFLQTFLDPGPGWAYMWSLVAPTSVGIGLIIFGWWSEQPQLRRAGFIVTMVGLLLFLTLGVMFEVLFNLNGEPTPGRLLLPLMIIGIGVALLFGRNLFEGLYTTLVTGPGIGNDSLPSGQIIEPREKGLGVVEGESQRIEENVEREDAGNP